MKIAAAIKALMQLQAKYGDDVPVFFDCPNCLQSFTPGRVETMAVHLKIEPPSKDKDQV